MSIPHGTVPVRVLLGFQILTSAGAIVALTLTILHAGDLKTGRHNAARDSCRLLRGLVYASTTNAPKQRRATRAYINRTPLRDCDLYARQVNK